ncbi:hypothetical protein [Brevundimonas sp. CEF1]|uniref:hypothetical protein n=1 Tax=Brevundimonas sp. CEF1 TaxID=3442642 RepID=UPI003F518EF3
MHRNPHEASAKAVRSNRPVEAQYVRQGRKGSRIMAVLLGGLVLTAVGFAVVWAFWAGPFASAPVDNGTQVEDAAAFQQDASATLADNSARAGTTADEQPATSTPSR